MFAKRKKQPSIEVTKLSSFIAEDVQITGDVCFVGGLRIDGRVRGNVIGRAEPGQARALLVLSERGEVEGNILCGDAVINGSVVGDLAIAHLLELQSHSRITGAVRYQHLQMDVGASVRGELLKVDDAAPAADTNVVELAVENSARR